MMACSKFSHLTFFPLTIAFEAASLPTFPNCTFMLTYLEAHVGQDGEQKSSQGGKG